MQTLQAGLRSKPGYLAAHAGPRNEPFRTHAKAKRSDPLNPRSSESTCIFANNFAGLASQSLFAEPVLRNSRHRRISSPETFESFCLVGATRNDGQLRSCCRFFSVHRSRGSRNERLWNGRFWRKADSPADADVG